MRTCTVKAYRASGNGLCNRTRDSKYSFNPDGSAIYQCNSCGSQAKVKVIVIKCRNSLVRTGKLHRISGRRLRNRPGTGKCSGNTNRSARKGYRGRGRSKIQIIKIKRRNGLTGAGKAHRTSGNRVTVCSGGKGSRHTDCSGCR